MQTLLRPNRMWMNNLVSMGILLYVFTNQSALVSCAQKSANGSAVDNRPTTAGSPKTFAFETHTSKYSQRFQGSKGKMNTGKADTGTVVFPDEIEENEDDGLPSRTSASLLGQKKNRKKDALESCGKGSTICERFDDYPKDILKEILAKKIGKSYQATIDVDGNSFLIPEGGTTTNPETPDAVVRTRINDIFSDKSKPKISPKVPGKDILSFGVDQDSSSSYVSVPEEETFHLRNPSENITENEPEKFEEQGEVYDSGLEMEEDVLTTLSDDDIVMRTLIEEVMDSNVSDITTEVEKDEHKALENDRNISTNQMPKADTSASAVGPLEPNIDNTPSNSTGPSFDIDESGTIFPSLVNYNKVTKIEIIPLESDLEIPSKKEGMIEPSKEGEHGGHGLDSNAIDSPNDDVPDENINKDKPVIITEHQNQNRVLIFRTDELDDTSIKNRIGTTEEFLCHSTPQVKFLHGAESKDGEWKFIVNDEDKFIQGVRVEQCSKDNAACKYADHFPPNLSARCAQKYIYRRLVAFNKETKELFNDDFKIPSCCVCVVSRLAHADDSAELRSMSANAPEPLALTAEKAVIDEDYTSKK